jgi:hypothetical protein
VGANEPLAGQARPADPPIEIRRQVEWPPRGIARPVAFPSRKELASVEVDEGVKRLVARLDDPIYVEREAATRALLDAGFDQLQLYALLAGELLSDEQRHRLLGIVWNRLLSIPRGALGINFRFDQPDRDQPGAVVVMDLVPGLPSEGLLRRGDRITHVDGAPLLRQSDLVWRVQTKRPGEEVRLAVERVRLDEDGRPKLDEAHEQYVELTVDVVLGSADLLTEFDGGQRPRKSEVELLREAEADWAATLFGPRPRLIEIAISHQPSAIRESDS